MTPAAPLPSTPFATAVCHFQDGRTAEAIEGFQSILRDDPAHSGARRNLIRALIAAGLHEAVITETTTAIHNAPESAELHFLRGTAFNALGRPSEGRDCLSTAIALNPKHAAAWLNLGNALMDLDDLSGAEAHCREALARDPALPEAHVSLGFILTCAGRVDEAIAVLESAIRLWPESVQAHWNLAVAYLLAGDLPRGFAEYEWRKRHDRFRRDFIDLPGPVWDGSDPCGQTILVHAEQGFGDTIQFARYLPLIAARGGTPVLACEPSLIPLLAAIPGARIVPKSEQLPRYDAWIDQMSLPRIFGTTPRTIPSPSGYLKVLDPVILLAQRSIGLAWSGNPAHSNDRRRTPPVQVFAPLLEASPCRLINLVPDISLPGLVQPPVPLTDYAVTASLIMALDLVITVDTSVAHVAGALGRPAWVLLPFAPDWRWMLNRIDTPWYDSVRLFRQPAPGAWDQVMAEVVAALAR